MERQKLAREREEAADALLQQSRPSNSARPSDEGIIPDSDDADPFPPPRSPSPESSSYRAQGRTSAGGDRFQSVLPTSALPPAGVTADQGAPAQFLDQIFEELSIGAQETRGDPGETPWNEPVYSASAPTPDGDGDGEPVQAPRNIEDTLRQSNSSLFDQDDESDAPPISTPLDDVRSVEDLAPPAFEEDPILRNIYIRAYVQAAFHGATHSDIANLLADQKATLLALSAREGFDLDLTKWPSHCGRWSDGLVSPLMIKLSITSSVQSAGMSTTPPPYTSSRVPYAESLAAWASSTSSLSRMGGGNGLQPRSYHRVTLQLH